ncbi:MAG: mechanosensitive ion channel [Desulfobacteraceae bacterium]|jgi:small-conductance mechanosensitive channel
MNNVAKRFARILAYLLLFACFANGVIWAQKFAPPKAKKPAAAPQEIVLPAHLQTPEQVEAFMGPLTDEQARQVLARVLKGRTAAESLQDAGRPAFGVRGNRLGQAFYQAADKAAALMKKLSGTLSEADARSQHLGDAWQKLTGGGGVGRFARILLALFFILAAGLLLRGLLVRRTRDVRERSLAYMKLGRMTFLGRVVAHLTLEILGICVYAATTFILFVLFFQKGDLGYELISITLIVSYYLLLFVLAAKVIFSPGAPAMRLFPMTDGDAAFLYRWILYIAAGAAAITGASAVLEEIGAGEPVWVALYSLAGVYITIVLVAMIWKSRRRVAEAIRPAGAETAEGGPRAALAQYWHYLASVYVLGMGVFWVADALLGDGPRVLNLVLSLFVIPVFIGLDQWGLRLLKLASGEVAELVDLSGDRVREVPPLAEESRIKHYAPLILKLYRLVLAAFLFFIVLGLWGVSWSVGRFFTSHVLSIVVTLLLGFIAWEFVKARIDSRLRQEMPAADEEMEEGGAGGSRIGTLLVLLRKFILTVLLVIVSLIVLSALGVNIGPLIAGAGVIGLAIGFGAQTLVRDIISGVFFLIDDSFRIGDYVESGEVKGTVEKISLRSMKLRHPRGMVYTVPFGNLKSVTNFSRDYIITKLEFRVRYDTDVEMVRKIIKKINKQLRKDEAFNRAMLDDLKSQGVKQFEDSGMILRVKFKTVPGEQFIIRREVFRMMQEEFHANGIEFAHRNVTVYMPPELQTPASEAGGPVTTAQSVDRNALQAGAAAAQAVLQQEEEERLKAQAGTKGKGK